MRKWVAVPQHRWPLKAPPCCTVASNYLLQRSAGLPEVCGICASLIGTSQTPYSIASQVALGTSHLAIWTKPCITDRFMHAVSSPVIRCKLFLSQQPQYFWNIVVVVFFNPILYHLKQTLSWELLESFAAQNMSPFLELCSWQLQEAPFPREVL